MSRVAGWKNDSERILLVVNNELNKGLRIPLGRHTEPEYSIDFPWSSRPDKYLWVCTRAHLYHFYEVRKDGRALIQGLKDDESSWVDYLFIPDSGIVYGMINDEGVLKFVEALPE